MYFDNMVKKYHLTREIIQHAILIIKHFDNTVNIMTKNNMICLLCYICLTIFVCIPTGISFAVTRGGFVTEL